MPEDSEFKDLSQEKWKEQYLLLKRKLCLSHELIKKYNDTIKENDRLKKELSSVKTELSNVTMSNNTNMAKNIELQLKNDTLNSSIESLKKTVEENNIKTIADKKYVEHLTDKIVDLEMNMKNRDDKIIELNKKLKLPKEKKKHFSTVSVQTDNLVPINENNSSVNSSIKDTVEASSKEDKDTMTEDCDIDTNSKKFLICQKCDFKINTTLCAICDMVSKTSEPLPPIINLDDDDDLFDKAKNNNRSLKQLESDFGMIEKTCESPKPSENEFRPIDPVKNGYSRPESNNRSSGFSDHEFESPDCNLRSSDFLENDTNSAVINRDKNSGFSRANYTPSEKENLEVQELQEKVNNIEKSLKKIKAKRKLNNESHNNSSFVNLSLSQEKAAFMAEFCTQMFLTFNREFKRSTKRKHNSSIKSVKSKKSRLSSPVWIESPLSDNENENNLDESKKCDSEKDLNSICQKDLQKSNQEDLVAGNLNNDFSLSMNDITQTNNKLEDQLNEKLSLDSNCVGTPKKDNHLMKNTEMSQSNEKGSSLPENCTEKLVFQENNRLEEKTIENSTEDSNSSLSSSESNTPKKLSKNDLLKSLFGENVSLVANPAPEKNPENQDEISEKTAEKNYLNSASKSAEIIQDFDVSSSESEDALYEEESLIDAENSTVQVNFSKFFDKSTELLSEHSLTDTESELEDSISESNDDEDLEKNNSLDKSSEIIDDLYCSDDSEPEEAPISRSKTEEETSQLETANQEIYDSPQSPDGQIIEIPSERQIESIYPIIETTNDSVITIDETEKATIKKSINVAENTVENEQIIPSTSAKLKQDTNSRKAETNMKETEKTSTNLQTSFINFQKTAENGEIVSYTGTKSNQDSVSVNSEDKSSEEDNIDLTENVKSYITTRKRNTLRKCPDRQKSILTKLRKLKKTETTISIKTEFKKFEPTTEETAISIGKGEKRGILPEIADFTQKKKSRVAHTPNQKENEDEQIKIRKSHINISSIVNIPRNSNLRLVKKKPLEKESENAAETNGNTKASSTNPEILSTIMQGMEETQKTYSNLIKQSPLSLLSLRENKNPEKNDENMPRRIPIRPLVTTRNLLKMTKLNSKIETEKQTDNKKQNELEQNETQIFEDSDSSMYKDMADNESFGVIENKKGDQVRELRSRTISVTQSVKNQNGVQKKKSEQSGYTKGIPSSMQKRFPDPTLSKEEIPSPYWMLNNYFLDEFKVPRGLRKRAPVEFRKIKFAEGQIRNLIDNQEWTEEIHNEVIKQLTEHCTSDHILNAIIQFLESLELKEPVETAFSPPAPFLTRTQQKIVTLIYSLEKHFSNIFKESHAVIEFKLFRLNDAPKADLIECLSGIYISLARIKKDRERVRCFCIDALYCYNLKAVVIIYTALRNWPEVLPIYGSMEDKLAVCIMLIIMNISNPCGSYNKLNVLKKLVVSYYKFPNEGINVLEFVLQCLEDLKTKPENHNAINTALILLAKKESPEWAYKYIIQGGLMRMIINRTHPSSYAAFDLLGNILRSFPIGAKEDRVKQIMEQLCDLLDAAEGSHEEQESIARALLCLGRHDFYKVARSILKWKPKDQLRPDTIEKLEVMFHCQPLDRWQKFISNNYQAPPKFKKMNYKI